MKIHKCILVLGIQVTWLFFRRYLSEPTRGFTASCRKSYFISQTRSLSAMLKNIKETEGSFTIFGGSGFSPAADCAVQCQF